MSRIGKLPVELPNGVSASIAADAVSISGPKGNLSCSLREGIAVEEQDKTLLVKLTSQSKQAKANYGSTRSHLQNMVQGVTDGWKKVLELSGVGFTAKLEGQNLVLALGYSHDVKFKVPQGIDCKVSKTQVEVEGADKQLVGQFAAQVRKACPPEPYLGKGVKYSDEQIRRKAGKAGK